MQDSDLELLKLAALAADIEFAIIHGTPRRKCDEGWTPWNPLDDDGTALRLAVKLRINVEPVYVWHGPWTNGGTLEDPYAATRRVIVRAAAEIGLERKRK
jgi:hypothetical protein